MDRRGPSLERWAPAVTVELSRRHGSSRCHDRSPAAPDPSRPSNPSSGRSSSTATRSSRSPSSCGRGLLPPGATARSTRRSWTSSSAASRIDIVTVAEALERTGRPRGDRRARLPGELSNPTPTAVHADPVRPDRRAQGGPAEPDRGGRARSPASATRTRPRSRRRSTGRRRSCSPSASGASAAGFSPLKTLLHDAYDRLDYLHAHRGEISGVRTGFTGPRHAHDRPPEERPR